MAPPHEILLLMRLKDWRRPGSVDASLEDCPKMLPARTDPTLNGFSVESRLGREQANGLPVLWDAQALNFPL